MASARKPPSKPTKTGNQGAHERGNDTTDIGHVPDSRAQERDQAKQAMAQSRDNKKLKLNEGGRTNESDEKGNPPNAVHGLPTPSLRGTWR